MQVAVKAIRTALLYSNSKESVTRSPTVGARRKLLQFSSVDRLTSDLMNPSPRPSPPLHRRTNGSMVTSLGTSEMNGFDKVCVRMCVCVFFLLSLLTTLLC